MGVSQDSPKSAGVLWIIHPFWGIWRSITEACRHTSYILCHHGAFHCPTALRSACKPLAASILRRPHRWPAEISETSGSKHVCPGTGIRLDCPSPISSIKWYSEYKQDQAIRYTYGGYAMLYSNFHHWWNVFGLSSRFGNTVAQHGLASALG